MLADTSLSCQIDLPQSFSRCPDPKWPNQSKLSYASVPRYGGVVINPLLPRRQASLAGLSDLPSELPPTQGLVRLGVSWAPTATLSPLDSTRRSEIHIGQLSRGGPSRSSPPCPATKPTGLKPQQLPAESLGSNNCSTFHGGPLDAAPAEKPCIGEYCDPEWRANATDQKAKREKKLLTNSCRHFLQLCRPSSLAPL